MSETHEGERDSGFYEDNTQIILCRTTEITQPTLVAIRIKMKNADSTHLVPYRIL